MCSHIIIHMYTVIHTNSAPCASRRGRVSYRQTIPPLCTGHAPSPKPDRLQRYRYRETKDGRAKDGRANHLRVRQDCPEAKAGRVVGGCAWTRRGQRSSHEVPTVRLLGLLCLSHCSGPTLLSGWMFESHTGTMIGLQIDVKKTS